MLARFFRSRAAIPSALPAVPPGERVYAIGDIHGRLDLLDEILARVAEDDRARPDADKTVIFLGDLVDRGPDSSGVIDRLIRLFDAAPECRLLKGNHEEIFLLAVGGDMEALRLWNRVGGRETILSYGITPAEYDAADFNELMAMLGTHVPEHHLRFLRDAEDLIVIGDYAFAHAGIRPEIALEEQKPADLRWIRREFLDFRGTLEKVVVHGHTIATEVEALPHRIGIDTGAFRSGRLTALGLEGTDRWQLQTEGAGTPD